MCCFSRSVRHVSATRIFARALDEGRQALAYAMNLEIDEALAMVLPLPVAPGGGDDTVSFVSLEGYAELFADLDRAFPAPVTRSQGLAFAPAARLRPKLAVHDVGAFEASYVPSPGDFDRLDARFRVPAALLSARPAYRDFGFAVFRLKPQKSWLGAVKRQTVHPMAFTFPRRDPRALFCPTLHVHDGTVPERAAFDHALYCQSDDEVLTRTFAWTKSPENAARSVDAARTRGLVNGPAPLFLRRIDGDHPNIDVSVAPPRCAGPHVLSGRGDRFAFALAAMAAYYDETNLHAQAIAWRDTAQGALDRLHGALAEGLPAITARHAEAWSLAPYDEAVSQVWLSNRDVHRDPFASPLRPGEPIPCRVDLGIGTARVEPQRISLCFARVPSPAVLEAIEREVKALLDRAIPA